MNPLLHVAMVILMLSEPALAQTRTAVTIRGKNQELYLYGSRGSTPVILSSGDLGWAGLVTHVAEFLESKGYFVVGVSSRAYLSTFTTRTSVLNPQDVPQDYQALIDFARQEYLAKPLLVGISEGAGLSVLAATAPVVKASIQGIVGVGLPDENELGWRWQDSMIWITKKTPNEPSFKVQDIINKVSPVPLAEIHSTHDEFLALDQAKAMFARAGEPKKMWVVEAANHRFSNNRAELCQRLLEALAWIQDPHSGDPIAREVLR